MNFGCNEPFTVLKAACSGFLQRAGAALLDAAHRLAVLLSDWTDRAAHELFADNAPSTNRSPDGLVKLPSR